MLPPLVAGQSINAGGPGGGGGTPEKEVCFCPTWLFCSRRLFLVGAFFVGDILNDDDVEHVVG